MASSFVMCSCPFRMLGILMRTSRQHALRLRHAALRSWSDPDPADLVCSRSVNAQADDAHRPASESTSVPTMAEHHGDGDAHQLVADLARSCRRPCRAGVRLPCASLEDGVDGAGGEDTGEQRAECPARAVNAEGVQRIVVAEARLHVGDHAVSRTTPAIKPMSRADMGPTNPDGRSDGDQSGDAPEMAPSTLGLPLRIHSAPAQPMAAAAAAKWVATKALVARLPALSALPALKPNQPTHSRQAPMKLSTTLCGGMGSSRITKALAEIERADQGRDARGDVHDGAAGEIERREAPAQAAFKQAALAPDHVRHRGVDHERPQDHEQQHRAELHALGEGAA